MNYWAEVTRRAWGEAAKTVKLDSRKLVMVLVLGQITVGTIIYLALGAEGFSENLLARSAAIAAPMLLFVPLFVWEFISAPPKMHAEQAAEIQRLTAESDDALRIATSLPARDSTILDLQEQNAALKTEMSAIRQRTDADYPFNTAQRAALIAILSEVPAEARFPVEVRHAGFGGTSDYARRMARAFREASWSVEVVPDPMVNATNAGIHIATQQDADGKLDPLPDAGEVLRAALTGARLQFQLSGLEPAEEPWRPSWVFFVFQPSD